VVGRKISIIIPVLNEAKNLPKTLAVIPRSPELEVIIVDAGSHDQSVDIAKQFGALVLQELPGRAQQMNAGAKIATGNVFLFLHADTQLPDHFVAAIEQTLAKPGVVAGAFDLSIQGHKLGLRLVEWGVYWRSRVCQLPYGDQAIFLTAHTFHQLSGFPNLPILEDFVFMQRLKRFGSIAIAPGKVVTSSRRWQQLGIFQTTLINQFMLLGYSLGLSPDRLAHWYRRLK